MPLSMLWWCMICGWLFGIRLGVCVLGAVFTYLPCGVGLAFTSYVLGVGCGLDSIWKGNGSSCGFTCYLFCLLGIGLLLHGLFGFICELVLVLVIILVFCCCLCAICCSFCCCANAWKLVGILCVLVTPVPCTLGYVWVCTPPGPQ
jgi:hypothetical protein